MRWGILGTAEIAVEMVRAVGGSERCEVRAVASRDAGRARDWADRHGIDLSFGSYEDLLRSDAVDLVYVPLPNSLHAAWTLRSLETGHPVLCEKPLAANAAEAREVQAAAARTGLHVAEGFMYRHHPLYGRVLELIGSDAIGDVSTIHGQFTFLLEDRSAIPASPELAGGALMDVGCYCVDVARLIAGCEPVRVSAFERRSTVDDVFMGMLDFPNGILAQFEAGIAGAERHRVEIAGTTGAILLDRPWLPGEAEARLVVRRWGREDDVLRVEGANPYRLQVEDFVAVCAGERAPRWTVEDAVRNMEVIDALFASARQGRAVSVPAGRRR